MKAVKKYSFWKNINVALYKSTAKSQEFADEYK